MNKFKIKRGLSGTHDLDFQKCPKCNIEYESNVLFGKGAYVIKIFERHKHVCKIIQKKF